MNGTAVVVDDSPEMGHSLAAILNRLGLRVVAVCESGSGGLQALRAHRPTIATIDIQMPGVNGLDVVRTAIAEEIPTKLVVCSGTAQRHVKDQARDAGALAFVTKPYDQVLVQRDLAKLLEG